jgi:eukaryotic-like serine/threonine-protein kinase
MPALIMSSVDGMGKGKWIVLIAIVLLLSPAYTALASASKSGGDWPMFHRDTTYTGATNNTAPKTSPTVLWSTQSQGISAISPAIVDGIVYASSASLFAFNASSGENLWNVTNGGQTSPIVADGIVYTGAHCGTAYNGSTGTVIWSREIQGFDSDAIAVYDGYFYTDDDQGFAQALNATTGKVIWNSTSAGFYFYPAVSNGYIYCGAGSIFRALNAYNGKEIWQTHIGNDNYSISSNPAVSSGYVYFGCEDRKVYCLDAYTG